MECSETHKQFLLDILKKVTYLNFKFKYDTLSFPTDEQVEGLKVGTYQHKIRLDILHLGVDNDPEKDQGEQWLTYCGCVIITHWSEPAIVEAIFKTLIQKLRHEASETFKYEGKLLFHEHRTQKIAIPQ